MARAFSMIAQRTVEVSRETIAGMAQIKTRVDVIEENQS